MLVDVAAVQETHFTCAVDCQMLRDDCVVYFAFGNLYSTAVSQLFGRTFNVVVHLVVLVDGGQLVVANVTMNSLAFRNYFSSQRAIITPFSDTLVLENNRLFNFRCGKMEGWPIVCFSFLPFLFRFSYYHFLYIAL